MSSFRRCRFRSTVLLVRDAYNFKKVEKKLEKQFGCEKLEKSFEKVMKKSFEKCYEKSFEKSLKNIFAKS